MIIEAVEIFFPATYVCKFPTAQGSWESLVLKELAAVMKIER